jgi:hypothetical protein
MVDELGIEVITVTMCLRQRGDEGISFCLIFIIIRWRVYNLTSIGFPPTDVELRNWLRSDIGDQATVQKRLHGFIYSLLKITCGQLETIAKEQRDYPQLLPRLLANNNADIPNFSHSGLYGHSQQDLQKWVVERQMKLASAFRKYMTYSQTYHAPNSNRVAFYKRVIELAKKVSILSFSVYVRMTLFSGS